jgi:hypothetical protein
MIQKKECSKVFKMWPNATIKEQQVFIFSILPVLERNLIRDNPKSDITIDETAIIFKPHEDSYTFHIIAKYHTAPNNENKHGVIINSSPITNSRELMSEHNKATYEQQTSQSDTPPSE